MAASAPPGAVQAFDLARLDRVFLDAPYPTYRALREHDPVHRMPDGSYFLTRYDDLVEVYRDTRTWSSDKKIQFKPNFGDSPKMTEISPDGICCAPQYVHSIAENIDKPLAI